MKRISALTTTALAIGYANTPAAARVEPQLTGGVFKPPSLPPPKVTNRGSASKYPFGDLTEIGMAFGVKNKDARGMSAIVSNQNKKNRTVAKDADGNDRTIQHKAFRAIDVDTDYAKVLKGTPLDGAKAIVVRIDPNA